MARRLKNGRLLQVKTPGGGRRPICIRDRPYWVNVEERATMVTLWVFLDDIGLEDGCLKLNEKNLFTLDKGYLFNQDPDLLPHITNESPQGP
jgi:hypothetical protein